MNSLTVSVIMSVYNGASYLRESIESILKQTFSDFEFVIIDDCSSDDSFQLMSDYATTDQRIVLLKNEVNLGLAASLNRGLAIAQGTYIARIDVDDIAMPNRLQEQVTYMDTHPDVALVSTGVQYIDPAGNFLGAYYPPLDFTLLQWNLIYGSPLRHPSVLWRKNLVASIVQGYNTQNRYAEDYEFFCQIAHHLKIATLPSQLLKMRQRPDSVSFSKGVQQDSCAAVVTYQQFNFYFNDNKLTDAEKHALRSLLRRYSPIQEQQFQALNHVDLEKACKNYLELFKQFCQIHTLEMNAQKADILHAEIERNIAQLSQYCLSKGWKRMSAKFMLSYLKQYPYRTFSLSLVLLTYLTYTNIKGIKLFDQSLQQVKALYYKRLRNKAVSSS